MLFSLLQDIQIICIRQYIIEISSRHLSVLEGVHSNEKNHDPCGGTLNIDIDQAVLHAGFSHDGLHLGCEVVETVVGGGRYVDGLLHKLTLPFKSKLGNYIQLFILLPLHQIDIPVKLISMPPPERNLNSFIVNIEFEFHI